MLERIPLHRHAVGELIYLADHGGSGVLGGLHVKNMKGKGLIEADTTHDRGVDCSMTNLGWLTLLQQLGYDESMLEEMWPNLGHMVMEDSYPFWRALYRYYQRERDRINAEVLQDA